MGLSYNGRHCDNEWIPWLSNIAARYEITFQGSLLTIGSPFRAGGSGSTDKIFAKNGKILVTRSLVSRPMSVLFVCLRFYCPIFVHVIVDTWELGCYPNILQNSESQ